MIFQTLRCLDFFHWSSEVSAVASSGSMNVNGSPRKWAPNGEVLVSLENTLLLKSKQSVYGSRAVFDSVF